jgi:HD domain
MPPAASQRLPFVAALSRAANTRAIYPSGHPKVGEALAALDKAVAASLRSGRAEALQIVAIEGELIVDGRPVTSDPLRFRAFARSLVRLGVESLVCGPGLDAEECRRLVDGLSGAGPLEPSPHVAIGRLQLTDGGTEGGPKVWLSEHDLDRAEEAFRRLRADAEGGVEQLGHLVWAFIEGLARTRRSLLLAMPGEGDPDRALFLHSLNVALLALAQAEGLGIRGQALHDLGLAALLHDVGKLRLPKALFERRGRLDERQWQAAQLHPALGAALLSGLRSAPEVAVLVAYEHHWRWDGHPSYPVPSSPRMPSLASQLTAVADTYDAMIAGPGLQRSVAGEAALEVWRRRSGTWLDPLLVASFLPLVG